MDKLLPCPMCNGKADAIKGHASDTVWPHGDFHRVFCTSCQIRQLFYRTEEDAIAAWNTRHTPEGWQLVPVAPTIGMVDHGAQSIVSWDDGCTWPESWGVDAERHRKDCRKAYHAMLAAAPKWGGE